MSCHVMPYDVTRTCMDLRDREYLRDHLLGLILFFWTYSAYLSFEHRSNIFCFRSFSQRYMWRVFILLEVVSSPVSRALLVISHRSFILFHISGTSVQYYLLTINKTRVIRVLQYLFSSLHFCRFNPLHSTYSWIIPSTANIATCTFLSLVR